jgi:hypothetical protein
MNKTQKELPVTLHPDADHRVRPFSTAWVTVGNYAILLSDRGDRGIRIEAFINEREDEDSVHAMDLP